MIAEATPIDGAYVMRLEKLVDERGFFARTFCVDEFADAGIDAVFVQQSLARNTRRGTLRGMHLQTAPYMEAKYVRCVRGRIFDAIVDLRPQSPSYRRTFAIELDDEGGDAIFIPAGCAHGYQTLVDRADVLYAMSHRHVKGAGCSIRWNDPALGIAWPIAPPILSEKDAAASTLEEFLTATYGTQTV